MIVVSIIPAPLWAAAIAPQPVTQELESSMEIPTFRTSNASTLWNGDLSTAFLKFGEVGLWQNDQGLFSFNMTNLNGPLRDSASAASVITNGTNTHAKLDNTGFVYQGRSYGTGACAGFTKIHDVDAPISYQYNERGLQATVSCFYNDSIAYGFSLLSEDLPIDMWQSGGESSIGDAASYIPFIAWLPNDLFSWDLVYNMPEHKIQVQLITGTNGTNKTEDHYSFSQFINVQCDISLKEQDFEVLVNNVDRLVISKPLSNNSQPDWPDYGYKVTKGLEDKLGRLTFGDSCFGGCDLGITLVQNINQLLNQRNDGSNATFQGTEDAIASFVDNILIDLLLTRLASNAPEPTEETTVIVTLPAIAFGDIRFIWAVWIINLIILLAYIFEAIRTRAWAATPPLDIMNDSQVIVAALEGGRHFKRDAQDGRSRVSHRERFSDNTLLALQYDGVPEEKPRLVPRLPVDGIVAESVEQDLLGEGLVSSQDTMYMIDMGGR